MPLTDDPWLATNADGSVSPVRRGAPVAVFRYDGAGALSPLPNVECLGIESTEGTHPGSARFRYNLASGLDGAPVSIETALGTDFTGSLVVNSGDQLVVQGLRPDGTAENLFWGLAIEFSMGLDPEIEEVYLGAVGIGWHAWDAVIPGALTRNAGSGARIVKDTPTMIPAQFNPGGRPNCTPDGYMAGSASRSGDYRYPTFLDPLVISNPDPRTYWTLAKACRYLLYTMNPSQQYVQNPDGAALDAMLVSPSDSGDTLAPINCPDTPITGKDWPVTVNRLVSECGFGTRFRLSTDDSGLPVASFDIFKTQAGPLKQLYLAARGTPFDPTLFNINGSGLSRDLTGVVNQWTVVGAPDRYEVTVVLACGFPMASGDTTPSALATFDKSNDAYSAANRYAYRLYVFSETGDGCYDVGTSLKRSESTSLDDLFGAPGGDGTAKYARRRRIPLGDLVTLDPTTKKPLEARLAISTDYTGPKPGLWNGSGTWQPVTSSNWRLLSDRLGIEITDANPNAWDIGKPTTVGMPFPSGVVHGVEGQATAAAGKNFYLRLTCVIEADSALAQVAAPRGGSPLAQTIARVIDASDRYRRDYVDYPSEFNKASGGANLNPRNDEPAALAEAQSIRAGTEAGVLSGPVTIPRLTTYYQVGDRIQSIEGRNLGLRTDQGTGDPIYPVVVGVRHEFGPASQSTTIELSDAGTDRTKYDRRPKRPFQYVHGGRRGRSPGESGGGMAGGGSGGTGRPTKNYTGNDRTPGAFGGPGVGA